MNRLEGLHINSVEDMQRFAKNVAKILKVGDCITLQGDLGAGKTTFTKALIAALTDKEVGVTSPTFTLSQSYDVQLTNQQDTTLWHYDLYRLEDITEIMELGIDEALEHGIAVIEWPDIALERLPEECISLMIEFGESSESRDVIFDIRSDETQQRLIEAGVHAGS